MTSYDVKIGIGGMTCGACARRIETSLKKTAISQGIDINSCVIDQMSSVARISCAILLVITDNPKEYLKRNFETCIVADRFFVSFMEIVCIDTTLDAHSNSHEYWFEAKGKICKEDISIYLEGRPAIKKYSWDQISVGDNLILKLDIILQQERPLDFYNTLCAKFPESGFMVIGPPKSNQIAEKLARNQMLSNTCYSIIFAIFIFLMERFDEISSISGMISLAALVLLTSRQVLVSGVADIFAVRMSMPSLLTFLYLLEVFKCLFFLTFFKISPSLSSVVDFALMFLIWHFSRFLQQSVKYFGLRFSNNILNRENAICHDVKLLIPGDKITLEAGSSIPIDCRCSVNEAFLDESFITGESNPTMKRSGDLIFQSSVLVWPLEVVAEVVTFPEDSFRSRLTSRCQSTLKSQTDDYFSLLINQNSRDLLQLSWYSSLLGILILVWYLIFNGENFEIIQIFLIFQLYSSILFYSCPCVIFILLPAYSLIQSLILKKYEIYCTSGTFMAVTDNSVILFDKTGTLTNHVSKIERWITFPGYEPTQDLDLLLVAELQVAPFHPVTRALLAHHKPSFKDYQCLVQEIQYVKGRGIKFLVNDTTHICGNSVFMKENSVDIEVRCSEVAFASNLTPIYFAKNNTLVSIFMMDFTGVSEEVKTIVQELVSQGKAIGMVTGDARGPALDVASQLGIPEDNVFSDLLPTDKQIILKKARNGEIILSNIVLEWGSESVPELWPIKRCAKMQRYVVMIGDGVNDSLALKEADIGIAICHSRCGIPDDNSADLYITTADGDSASATTTAMKKLKLFFGLGQFLSHSLIWMLILLMFYSGSCIVYFCIRIAISVINGSSGADTMKMGSLVVTNFCMSVIPFIVILVCFPTVFLIGHLKAKKLL